MTIDDTNNMTNIITNDVTTTVKSKGHLKERGVKRDTIEYARLTVESTSVRCINS